MTQVLVLWIGLIAFDPTATTSAVHYTPQGAPGPVARIKNWTSGYQQPGPSIGGTGTLTAIDGEEALVLTAAHLFEKKVGPITVEFNDGQLSGARLLALDPRLDVAALWIYAPKGITPLPLAHKNPRVGEQVEIWGYGPKQLRSFVATVARPIPAAGDVPRTLVAAQGILDRQVTIPGDSGGPMVKAGQIVAVHWGYRGEEDDPRRCVHALGCTTVVDFLHEKLPTGVYDRCTAFNPN